MPGVVEVLTERVRQEELEQVTKYDSCLDDERSDSTLEIVALRDVDGRTRARCVLSGSVFTPLYLAT